MIRFVLNLVFQSHIGQFFVSLAISQFPSLILRVHQRNPLVFQLLVRCLSERADRVNRQFAESYLASEQAYTPNASLRRAMRFLWQFAIARNVFWWVFVDQTWHTRRLPVWIERDTPLEACAYDFYMQENDWRSAQDCAARAAEYGWPIAEFAPSRCAA